MHMEIEWDLEKATSNLQKHGVSFEEASTALLDPLALAQEDATSEGELRWVLIGMSARAPPDGHLHVTSSGSNSPHLGTQGHA